MQGCSVHGENTLFYIVSNSVFTIYTVNWCGCDGLQTNNGRYMIFYLLRPCLQYIYIWFFLAILMVEGLWFKDGKEVSHSCMSNLLLKRQLIIFKWSYLIHLSCKKRIVLNTCTYYWTKKGADWQFWTKVKQTKIHFVLSSFNYSNLSLEFLLENLQSIKFTM